MESESMLNPREKFPLPQKFSPGGSSPQRYTKQDEPNTLPKSYSSQRPLFQEYKFTRVSGAYNHSYDRYLNLADRSMSKYCPIVAWTVVAKTANQPVSWTNIPAQLQSSKYSNYMPYLAPSPNLSNQATHSDHPKTTGSTSTPTVILISQVHYCFKQLKFTNKVSMKSLNKGQGQVNQCQAVAESRV